MNRPTVYPALEDMSIKALKELLLREETAKYKAWMDEDDKEVPKVEEHRKTTTFIARERYPPPAVRELNEERRISADDALGILLESLLPYMVCWLIIAWIAISGY